MTDEEQQHGGAPIYLPADLAGRIRRALADAAEAESPLSAEAPMTLLREVWQRAQTGRVMSAEPVRQYEVLYKIIQHIPVMIVFYDRSGHILLVNREFERTAGWTLEETRRMDVMEACYPDPEYRREVWDYMMAAEPGWRTLQMHVRSGELLKTIWANVRLEDGAHIGIGVDVTERTQVEEDLRTTLNLVQAVVEQNPDIVFLKDAQGAYLLANPAAAALFGRPREEILGRDDRALFPPEEAARIMERDRAIMEKRRPETYEETLTIGDSLAVLETAKAPYYDYSGRMAGLVGVARDITERNRARAELQALNRALEQRSAQLQALASQLTESERQERRRLAQVLHDGLQQNLALTKLRSQAEARKTGDEGARRTLMEISSMLDDCIRESRSLTVELSPTILYEGGLAAALTWLGDHMEEAYGLRVHTEADAGAEPRHEALSVLLYESVREMLFNVLKHARVNECRVCMARGEADTVRIAVEDEGAGFDPNTVEQRGAGEEQAGFGLFSVRERLELHRGGLNIRSAPGRGTCMVLTAPLRPTPPTKPDLAESSPTSHKQHDERS